MAAPLLTARRCSQVASRFFVRRWLSAKPAPKPTMLSRLLLQLSRRFYDVEEFLNWTANFRNRNVKRKNLLFSYAQNNYGNNIAAAYYILSLNGGFRFVGQDEWFRSDARGKFSYDFMNFPDNLIEEVDLSGTQLNCDGLDNLVSQLRLRRLILRGCPEVDGWFLSRLHVFEDCLEELDISHCPRITPGALCALKNLRSLRRLNISNLPALPNPGLVRILVEEMLPHCVVIGAGYKEGLITEKTSQTEVANSPTHISTQTDTKKHGLNSFDQQEQAR